MSFSYSYFAAKCPIDDLQAAFLAAWPAFELAEPPQTFPSWDDAYQWAAPRCGCLKGHHPEDVKLLFRNNDWSALADFSMCMASDQSSLAELSRRVGRVVVATTQGTAGFAQLLIYEAGVEVRSITGVGGRVVQTGTLLPEEAGVSLATFYLKELDTVWQRLGLTSFLQADPAGPVVGLHVLDRTPHAEFAQAPRRSQSARRPWWRFW